MRRTMLSAKLHRVTVTQCALDYEGSCAIDEALLEASGLLPFERIDIYNITNGERFATYVIRAARDSGTISLNGAAARKAQVGDLLIIAAFAELEPSELAGFTPRLIYVDRANRITHRGDAIPVQPSKAAE